MNAIHVRHNRLMKFDEVPVGARLMLPPLGRLMGKVGVYYKTGPGSYGTRPEEPTWPWLDEAPYVKVFEEGK